MTRPHTPLPGVNYPWTVFRGKPNYGCDFGTNVWRCHSGVTAHLDVVRQDFAQMARAGAQVVRWFVFTDGRGGIDWRTEGSIGGLADRFFDDMDAALTLARDARVRVCLVLFDFSWMRSREEQDADGRRLFRTAPHLLLDDDGLARIDARVIAPLAARYGVDGVRADLGEVIHSFDVMNEPDWVTRGMAFGPWQRPRWLGGSVQPFSRASLRRFVRRVADRIHGSTRSLVTVGGARVRFTAEWDDPAYDLDFIQVHLYADLRHPRRDHALLGRRANTLGVSRPVVIGEFPANGDAQHPPGVRPPRCTLAEYLVFAREAGYLGAWPWSFKGIDAFGAVDVKTMRQTLDAGDGMGRCPIP